MSQWNSGPNPSDPNQAYYAEQPGYPPQQPGNYPPPGGYPAPGGYPPPGGYPTAPSQGPGVQPPPYALNDSYSEGTYEDANYSNDEEPIVKGFDFGEESVRKGFIKKVYSILAVQLAITLAFICWFQYHRKTQQYVQHHTQLFWFALVLVIVAVIALGYCAELRRKAPMNFVFLFIFTLAEAFLLATSASFHKGDAVALAVGVTAVVCLGLTLFAFQTKWDFTVKLGILFVGALILFLFSIIVIFIRTPILHLILSCAGALLFSVYLIYDTQLMMGGKHKYSISPEEYIFAALNLYVDIINIFMYILAIIGHSRD